MHEIRKNYFKKMQVALLTLGLLAVISFFLLFFLGEMALPEIIIAEATLITLLIFYSFYRVKRSKTYDERSTEIILGAFFLHCIIVYFLVSYDPLRVVWLQVFISLVFVFKGVKLGVIATGLSLLIVLFGNYLHFKNSEGFFEVQLIWTFVTSTIMISGAAAVVGRYYEDLFAATYSHSQLDGLTSAFNSKSFREKCEEMLEKAKTHNNNVAYCLIDLDNFKIINDEKGHLFGDKVLIMFSDTMKSKIGEDVLLGRLGGDEFSCMSLTEKFDKMQLEFAFKSVLKELQEKFRYTVGGSIGFSFSDDVGYDFNKLYRVADEAMYNNKAKKKT